MSPTKMTAAIWRFRRWCFRTDIGAALYLVFLGVPSVAVVILCEVVFSASVEARDGYDDIMNLWAKRKEIRNDGVR